MGTFNAFAFSLLGTLMGFMPALLPSYFPSTATAGSNVSELWLEFMGLVQGGLGTFYVVRNEVMPLLLRVLSWRIPAPRPAEQSQPAVILRPMGVGGYLSGQDTSGRRAAA